MARRGVPAGARSPASGCGRPGCPGRWSRAGVLALLGLAGAQPGPVRSPTATSTGTSRPTGSTSSYLADLSADAVPGLDRLPADRPGLRAGRIEPATWPTPDDWRELEPRPGAGPRPARRRPGRDPPAATSSTPADPDIAARRPDCRRMSRGEHRRRAAPDRRRTRVVLADVAAPARRPTGRAAELAEQTPVGEALVRGLVRAQLALALRLAAGGGDRAGRAAAAVRGGARRSARSRCSASTCRGCCSACCRSRSCSRSAGRTCAGRTQRAGLHRPDPAAGAVNPYVVPGARRWSRWSPSASARTGCGSPGPPRTSWSPPGSVSPTWNAAAISGEYLSAASLPRRRRPGAQVRRRRALVPGRVRRRLPGAAAVRGRAAAPLRRVHPARLLPGAAAARRGCAGWPPSFVVFIGWLYLVPQLQGAGLTLHHGHRRAVRVGCAAGRRWWSPANVALGGMRAITFVQAFQYWLKLTALAVPVIFLVLQWQADGRPAGDAAGRARPSRPRPRS